MTGRPELPEVERVERPPWVSDADASPESTNYMESERVVAGALSTMPPFNVWHPEWCLPFARVALDALSDWEPTDG